MSWLIPILAMVAVFWGVIWMAYGCDKSGRHFPGDPNRGGWPKRKKEGK
jgi:hypothetical protein